MSTKFVTVGIESRTMNISNFINLDCSCFARNDLLLNVINAKKCPEAQTNNGGELVTGTRSDGKVAFSANSHFQNATVTDSLGTMLKRPAIAHTPPFAT